MGAAPIPVSVLTTRLAAPVVVLANIATSIPYRQYCFAHHNCTEQARGTSTPSLTYPLLATSVSPGLPGFRLTDQHCTEPKAVSTSEEQLPSKPRSSEFVSSGESLGHHDMILGWAWRARPSGCVCVFALAWPNIPAS